MTKTLYISDLDGTLLNSQSVVSDYSRTQLRAMIADGLLFSIATARTPATVVKLMEGIEPTLPLIVMTGAAMWKDGLVERHYIPAEETTTLQRLCAQYGIEPFLYTYNGHAIDCFHSPHVGEFDRRFIEQRQHSPYKHFRFTDEIPAERQNSTMLMFSAGPYETMELLHREISASTRCSLSFYPDIFNPSYGMIEAMAEGTDKASALRRLAEECGAERIVVFGDSANDLSMRNVADCFIAPANAADCVKAIADEIIGSNDEDSVVRRIAADFRK